VLCRAVEFDRIHVRALEIRPEAWKVLTATKCFKSVLWSTGYWRRGRESNKKR
jgi:hypothetical protein